MAEGGEADWNETEYDGHFMFEDTGTRSPNLQDSDVSRLMIAVQTEKIEKVVYLLNRGVDVNLKTAGGISALHTACKVGNTAMMRLLLTRSALVNETAQCLGGETPLHVAVKKGHFECIRMLLMRRAKVDIPAGNPAYTSLHLASKFGKLDCLEELEKRVDYPKFLETQEHPIYLASHNGHINILKHYKNRDFDLSSRNATGRTLLHESAAHGQTNVVLYLCSNGADVNATDLTRNTPLHCAAYHGHTETCLTLLSQGADLNASSGESCSTPLFHTMYQDNLECFTKMLELVTNDLSLKDEVRNTLIHFAASQGAYEIVCHLLQIGYPDVKNHQGKTSLHMAAKGGHVKVASLLLNNGANINVQDTPDGNTPLHEAIIGGYPEIVKLFLDCGVDLTAKGRNGRMYQHLAADVGNIECLVLIQEHATVDLEMQDDSSEGNTPMHLAALGGHVKVISWLLDRGVSVDIQNREGTTPLSYAVSHTEVLRFILDRSATVNINNSSALFTPLHAAVKSGNSKAVDILLDADAEVTLYDINSQTPLHWAVIYDQFDCLKVMTARGCDLAAAIGDKHGDQAIHLAAMTGNIEMIKWLLDHDVRVDVRNRWGVTPLLIASYYGKVQAVEFLISKGASVNIRGKDPLRTTALHLAAMNGHCEVIELLLRSRAEVNVLTWYHFESPLHWSIQEDNLNCLKMLHDFGGDIWIHTDSVRFQPLLMKAVKHGAEKSILWLLENGLPVDYLNTFGLSPLHSATIRGHTNIVNILLQNGAFVDPQHHETHFKTPLHCAIEHERVDIVRILLSRGADPSLVTKYYLNAFNFAAMRGSVACLQELVGYDCNENERTGTKSGDLAIHIAASYGHVSVVQWLVEVMEVPIDIVNKLGMTPLHYAVRRNQMDVTKYLLDKGASIDVGVTERDGRTSLHIAAKKNYILMTSFLLEKGADPNIVTKGNRETPLHWAAEKGALQVIVLLADHSADIFMLNARGLTAEEVAIKFKKFQVRQYLSSLTRNRVHRTPELDIMEVMERYQKNMKMPYF